MSSFRIPAQHVEDNSHVEDESSSSEDEDDTWEDWVSDSFEKQPCKSLFDDVILPSASEALEHDKKTHGFDLVEAYSKLCTFSLLVAHSSALISHLLALDTHQRIRLVNWIRKEVSDALPYNPCISIHQQRRNLLHQI